MLTAILADDINLGTSKIDEACPGTTAHKLDWLASLHIRDEAYMKALAELVSHHHRHPSSEHEGEGATSSSDSAHWGQANLKLVQTQWKEILRLAASIRRGTVTASLIIRKLAS